jgi:flagellar biosynthesis protein FliR
MTISFPVLSALNINIFLLVFVRMSGAFLFNPILGRQNVPVMLRAALGFLCAIVITPTLTGVSVEINGVVQMMVMSLGELFIGMTLGIVVSVVIYVVQLAGEQIDAQMGLTMSKMYDAHSGVNMPIMGSFFNLIIIFCFFAANAHLTLMAFVTDSFRLIAPGAVFPTEQSLHFVVNLLGDYFKLGLQMAIPVIAVEIVCQIALGLLMRTVPTINIFAIGLQIEMLVGLVLMIVTIAAIVVLCGQLITFMVEKSAEVIRLMATG